MSDKYGLMNRFVTEREAIETRARLAKQGANDIRITDAVIDEQWARLQEDSRAPNPYFDYYFSGQDVKVYLGEIDHENDSDFGNLPMHGLGFNVTQEKAPIYGFWDYTYSTVMRGTRLVTGSFTLITKYPDYMKKLLTKAASNRAKNSRSLADDYPTPANWREDDANIERYWGIHLDPSATAQDGLEWSAHPPFTLVIVYGVQDTSIEVDKLSNVYDNRNDNALMFDHNQRLVEGFNPNQTTRIMLDGCELTSVARQYTSDVVLAETYEFFARDIFTPTNDYQRNRNRPAIPEGVRPI